MKSTRLSDMAAGPRGRSRAWLLVAGGWTAGAASGLLGVGGGLVLVPVLTSNPVGRSRRVASGTSLAAVVPIALVGVAVYGAHTDLDLVALALIAPPALAGAVIGANLTARVPERLLAVGFAGLATVVAVRLGLPGGGRDPGKPISLGVPVTTSLLVLGLVSGLLSGLLGIGGAIVLVPALTLGFHLPQQLAQGTSLAVIVPTGLVGAISHRRLGNVDGWATAILGLAGAVGGLMGALLAVRMPQRPLALAFAAYLLVVAFRSARPRAPSISLAGEPLIPKR